MKKLTESKFEKAFRELATKCGVHAYKFQSPSQPGVPDRILVGLDGTVVFVELKVGTNRPTPLQIHHLNKLRAQNAYACWINNMLQAREIIISLSNSSPLPSWASGRPYDENGEIPTKEEIKSREELLRKYAEEAEKAKPEAPKEVKRPLTREEILKKYGL